MRAWGLVHDPVGSRNHAAWESALRDLSVQQIRDGMARLKDDTKYFSLPRFRELCTKADYEAWGLVPARQAYIEAATKPSPKDRQRWSHPAVYMAGVATGWFDMAHKSEAQIFPLYEYHYTVLCRRVLNGEDLRHEIPKPLPREVYRPQSRSEQLIALARLRADTGLVVETGGGS